MMVAYRQLSLVAHEPVNPNPVMLIDEFMVDLYSLGPDLLTQLWDYTTEKKSQPKAVALSPFSLVQANANM